MLCNEWFTKLTGHFGKENRLAFCVFLSSSLTFFKCSRVNISLLFYNLFLPFVLLVVVFWSQTFNRAHFIIDSALNVSLDVIRLEGTESSRNNWKRNIKKNTIFFLNNLFLHSAIDTVFHPSGIIQNGRRKQLLQNHTFKILIAWWNYLISFQKELEICDFLQTELSFVLFFKKRIIIYPDKSSMPRKKY